MHTLYLLTLAIIFCVACSYISIKLNYYVIPKLIWSFIMVPILSIYWFPTWVLLFWISFSIQTIFGRGTLQVYQMSAFQRKYGGICDTISLFILGAAILDFIFYLFR